MDDAPQTEDLTPWHLMYVVLQILRVAQVCPVARHDKLTYQAQRNVVTPATAADRLRPAADADHQPRLRVDLRR